VWSRAAIWLAALLALAWFGRHGSYGLALWARWDSGWFLRIAEHGYASREGTAAFFPAYPGLVAILGRVFLGHYALAGLAVSLVSCAVAFVLLWRLAEERLGHDGAFRTVLYLAVFPVSLFLQAVYSEALYLAAVLAAFSLAERRRWTWAGVAAALALLTRSAAIALLAALVVLAWPDLRQAAWLLLAPLAFLAFPLVLQRQIDEPWAFLHAQAQWEREWSWAGPFGGLWEGVAKIGNDVESYTHAQSVAINVEGLVFCALFIVLAVLVWRWFGAVYGVFAAVSLALPLSTPAGDFPLLSLPRFGLVVFPFFLVLARVGERPRAHAAIVALSALGLGIAIAQWATYEWVA
jgi:hypothetical protein